MYEKLFNAIGLPSRSSTQAVDPPFLAKQGGFQTTIEPTFLCKGAFLGSEGVTLLLSTIVAGLPLRNISNHGRKCIGNINQGHGSLRTGRNLAVRLLHRSSQNSERRPSTLRKYKARTQL
jgi:predicted pyridoxine 5'-phosphate oxidase superfamily flavin-nucleotide-binding protein